MKLKDIILSWDLCISLIITLISCYLMPQMLEIKFCISFYNVGITVLAIVFSLFFAALAIIMTSSDNDFIEFLEENNDFTALLKMFKFTLIILFISLFYSIILYVASDYFATLYKDNFLQNKILFLSFEFLFSYGLLSTALCINDTIKFSQYRALFMKKKKQ